MSRIAARRIRELKDSCIRPSRGRNAPSGRLFSSSVRVRILTPTSNNREPVKITGFRRRSLRNLQCIRLADVNDFTGVLPTLPGNAQASRLFRLNRNSSCGLETRNDRCAIVPRVLSVSVTRATGPEQVMHYNGIPHRDQRRASTRL